MIALPSRKFLHWATAVLLAVGTLVLTVPAWAGGDFIVTLLGTASPAPRPGRMGPSTLVVVNGQRLLFDAGRGATIRLWQMRVPIGSLHATFLTHFHSDHTNGLPDIWLTGWIGTPYGSRQTPFRLIGPIDTRTLMEHLEKAYQADIDIRHKDEGEPLEGIRTEVTEFTGPSIVWSKDGVRVTAIDNDHGPLIKPSFGYKVTFDGRSAVISGDTRPAPSIIEASRGVDLLIHEVAAAREPLLANPFFRAVINHHTTPADAGRIFAEARPKLAVYTHIVLLSNKDNPEPTIDDVVEETRKSYDGPFVVGTDLMSFDIGKGGVSIVNHDVRQ
jgi:ribonuclease Z